MEPHTTGKELPTRQVAKPELVEIGKRFISSHGRWNDELIYQYLGTYGKGRWVKIGELASVAWGQNNIANKRRARRHLTDLWKYMLTQKQMLLSVNYAAEWPHSAVEVKIYDPNNEQERATLMRKIERLLTSRKMTVELYDGALKMLAPTPEAA